MNVHLDLPLDADLWGDVGEIADTLGSSREDVVVSCVRATVRRLRPTVDGRRRELLARLILDPRAALPVDEILGLVGYQRVTTDLT